MEGTYFRPRKICKDLESEYLISDAIIIADERKEELAGCVVDPFILKICALTMETSMTAQDIADNLGLPLATTYKLIGKMTELGLLANVGKVRTSLHGKAASYISIVKSGEIILDHGKFIINCHYKDGGTRCMEKYSAQDEEEDSTPEVWRPRCTKER